MLARACGAARGERRQHQRRDGVDHEADAERRFGAERHHEDEAGQRRSGDAAQRIERVRRSHVGGAGCVPGGREVGQEGEAEAHPNRRDQHDRAHGHAQQEQSGPGTELDVPEDHDHVQRQDGKKEEDERGASAGDPLSERRIGERGAPGSAAAGHETATEPDSQEEHKQHQRERVC